MWSPDQAPASSFADYAHHRGRQAAEDHWNKLYEQYDAAMHQAELDEAEMARQAELNPLRYAADGSCLKWEMASASFVKLYRASLNQRGAVGGELLDDDDFMRFFLKRNPACARKAVTGNIMQGWTNRLEAAAAAGQEDRARTQARVATILENAKSQAPLLVA
jgi:hypothetical protein